MSAHEEESAPESDCESSESDGPVEDSDNGPSTSSTEHVVPKKKNDKPLERTHPKMMEMISDSLKDLPDKKGATTIYIKSQILAKYPEVDGQRFKALFKRVFLKAINDGVLVRTKATENSVGLTGRVKLAANTNSHKASADTNPSAAAETAKSGGKKSATTDAGSRKRTEKSTPAANGPSTKAPKTAPSKNATTKSAKAPPGATGSDKSTKKSGSSKTDSTKTTKPVPDKVARKAPVKPAAAKSGSKTSTKPAPAKAAPTKRSGADAVVKKPARKQVRVATDEAPSE